MHADGDLVRLVGFGLYGYTQKLFGKSRGFSVAVSEKDSRLFNP